MNPQYMVMPHTPMPDVTPEEWNAKAQELVDNYITNKDQTITVSGHTFTIVGGTLVWNINALDGKVRTMSIRNDIQYLPVYTRESLYGNTKPEFVTTTLYRWCRDYGKAGLEDVEKVLGVTDKDITVSWYNDVLIVGQSSIDAIDPMPVLGDDDFWGFEYSHENLPCLWDFQGEFAVTIDGNIIGVSLEFGSTVDEDGYEDEYPYFDIKYTDVTPDRVWASFRSAKE